MNDEQITALLVIFIGVLPCYLIARYLENSKNYHLLAGWKPDKISDHDAYAKTIAYGLKGFAAVMAVGCLLFAVSIITTGVFVMFLTFLPGIPLVVSIVCAKKRYVR